MEVNDADPPRLAQLGISAEAGLLIAIETFRELERFTQLCLKLRTRALFAGEVCDAARSREDRWAQLALALLTDKLPKRRASASALDLRGLALNRYNSFDALILALLQDFDELHPSTDLRLCIAIPRNADGPTTVSIMFERTPEVVWVSPGSFVDARPTRLIVKSRCWCVAAIKTDAS